ncbi:hypothetical protein [Pseudaminobacter salicylatoxidans]|uniref:hypothetical protein n=1 Tax=Pseudaminobacter salicylatoxidans TaxID=93369 RepID=UPI0011B22B33|nr:hypothetical protein [Pseudaminobacter salicylatoxidans]
MTHSLLDLSGKNFQHIVFTAFSGSVHSFVHLAMDEPLQKGASAMAHSWVIAPFCGTINGRRS